MPLFEYRCNSCKHEFEELAPSSEAQVACPKCGAIDVDKLLSLFAASGAGSVKGTGCCLSRNSSGFG